MTKFNQHDNDEENEDDIVSKSAVKKALHDILSFGEKLLALSPKKLAELPLSELLVSEIELARKLKVDNSRRRQMQRIGKILRSENYEEIQQSYDEQQEQNRQHQQSGNPADKWCQQLLETPESLAEFVDRYPQVNRQQLGQTLRNAKKEKAANSNSKKQQQRLFKIVQQTLLDNT